MNRFEKGSISVVMGLTGLVGVNGIACEDGEKSLSTPTPIASNLETLPPSILQTPGLGTPIPAETGIKPDPITEFPDVPQDIMGDWKKIRYYYNQLEISKGAPLVKTDEIQISFATGGDPDPDVQFMANSLSAKETFLSALCTKAGLKSIENADFSAPKEVRERFTEEQMRQFQDPTCPESRK